jgi:transglutaminase-like putative cysteine protease
MRALIAAVLVSLPLASALAGPPRPATDEQIQAWIAAAGDASDHGGAATVVVLDESDVRVLENGLAETRNTRVVKILGDAGIRAHAVLRERFDPATNRVRIDSVRIHYGKNGQWDGWTETFGGAWGLVTQPTPARSIFWGHRQHLLDLPRLEIGDAIEIRTRRIGFNIAYLRDDEGLSGEGLEPPMAGHWYETVRFEGGAPILRKRYSVHMPAGKPLQFAVYNGTVRSSLWIDGDRLVYTFAAKDVPAVKREPSMASWDDCVTKVVMATVPDWLEKSRWFHRVNEGQFEADDAIRAKVAEITKDLESDDAKIAACLHWVADHIRYVGTSRGPAEGYTLHRGIETFHDRAGVCKDIAGMLITMLRVLGFEAYPALTMAGPRVEAIPADQFNHTVCVVRREDGRFQVLDPTWSPLSKELWSSREALQGLVYGTPEGQGLTLSPFFPAGHNLVHIRSDARLDETGKLSTTLDFALKGYGCTYLRRNLDRHPDDRKRGAIESVLNLAPNAELVTFSHTDPRDYSRDATARLEATADGYAAAGAERMVFRLPLLRNPLGHWLIADLLNPPKGGERRYPLRLRATRLVKYEEAIELPPGWTVENLPEPREVKSGSADLAFSASLDLEPEGPPILRWTLELRAKHHLVPAEDVAGLRKALVTMRELADEPILLKKGGAK